MKLKNSLVILLTLLAFPLQSSMAQEATVGGTLNNEMSWTALKSLIEVTNGKVSILRTDVDAINACGKLKKIWNGTACVEATNTDYENVVTCGDRKQVYDKSAKTCATPTVPAAPAPNCRFSTSTFMSGCGESGSGCNSGGVVIESVGTSGCGKDESGQHKKNTCLYITCS